MAGERARRWALDAWPLLLAIVLTAPLLVHGGLPLARDLVFVPHQPWTDASVGLGGATPRAVPLDTVMSALTAHLLSGGLVARLALPLILAAAGWGAHRAVEGLGLTGRLVAGGLAVWNPYVVERLALGQWALLAAYAALPWLFLAARRWRSSREWRDLAPVAAWLGLATLTPTGGLLGTATVLVIGWQRDRVRTLALAGCCLLLQLTWLLPSFLTTAALTSDPAGVRAFAAGGEGPGGVLAAALGLGGIWDSRSVPATRESWWTPVTALVVVLALVLGWRVLRRLWGGDLARIGALAVVGLLLTLLPATTYGDDLLRWMVEHVPGAGLLRDSQKLIAPYAVLAVAAVAATAHRLVRAAGRTALELAAAVAILALALPSALLPDGASRVWPTVDPVHYPAGLDAVAGHVDGGGLLATLPWRSYRAFSWGSGLVSSDPALRWFDTEVVTADDLTVGTGSGTGVVRGESALALRIGTDLAGGDVRDALARNGVTWALVYRDDSAAGDLDLAGLEQVYADHDLALYRVPDPAAPPPGAGAVTRAVVVAVDVVAGGAVVGAVALVVVTATRRRKRAAGQAALLP